MTCIVGVRAENGVVLAGDSVGSNMHTNTHRADKKTFNLSPEIAMGFTSSYRMGQILQWHIDIDPLVDTMHRYEDLWKWVGKLFIPAARAAFESHGYAKKESGREEGGAFLLAVRDRLFSIGEDFQVGESEQLFDATGSGEPIALGSLYSDLRDRSVPPSRVDATGAATRAIEAAAYLTPYVGGKITFAETTKP